MGRYIFWRTPLGRALTASALLCMPCVAAAQTAGTAQETEIHIESDWKRGVITFSLRESITPYAQQGYDAPAYQANRIWQTQFERIITDVLERIPYNGTASLLSEAKRRGISRRITEDAAQASSLTYNGLSADFAAVEGRFRLRLYPEIASLFPLATRAVEERAAWVASANYSGVVIIAQGKLPIHNDTAVTSARPTLSPVIYDEQLLTVLHAAMVKPAFRERHGVVGYDHAYEIDGWRWRVGNTPLLLYARGVTSEQGTDIIISNDDARRLLTREHNRNLLRNGKVLVILDSIIINNLLTVRAQ